MFYNLNSEIAPKVCMGEMINWKQNRVPKDITVRKNIELLATQLSTLKQEVKTPFHVTCGYIPPEEARSLGYTDDYVQDGSFLASMWNSLLDNLEYFFSILKVQKEDSR